LIWVKVSYTDTETPKEPRQSLLREKATMSKTKTKSMSDVVSEMQMTQQVRLEIEKYKL